MNLNWTVGTKGKWSNKTYCRLSLISLIVFPCKDTEGWEFQVKTALGKELHKSFADTKEDAQKWAAVKAKELLQEDLGALLA